ncbi:MAG TPA: penicillin-binding transpeptidase domain-containing protein, partial [Limnochordia bacterium]|nr:penicillin-binding transpeptidase domain-containing protein [Limnochordia bacterium]
MAERAHRLVLALLAGAVVCALAFGYWQWPYSPLARLDKVAANPRSEAGRLPVRRGGVFDRHGEPLLAPVPTGPSPAGGARTAAAFPPAAGPLIGYRDVRLGESGLEAAFDSYLRGAAGGALWRWFAPPSRPHEAGDDVITTLDGALERAAAEALGDRTGAIAVVDAQNGEILALASGPGFDPTTAASTWRRLLSDPAQPLFPRATLGLYPPGSTFKIVVLAAALATGRVRPDDVFDDPGTIVVDGAKLHDDVIMDHGSLSTLEAFAHSSNVAFVQIGQRTGAEAIQALAARLHLGDRPESFALALPAVSGRIPPLAALDARALAQISFGQGGLLVSPLEMALIAAAIADGGVWHAPRLLRRVTAPGGRIVKLEAPLAAERVLPPQTAAETAWAMRLAVTDGTGRGAELPDVAVAGKTGTAENPHGAPHAWFVGFAPAGAPRLAFA